ncbi:MAG: tRNA uridine-5-carboxymethylaminomethyl(34) synthesis GTPase MnmE [Eubacteriaceae bacterium]
MSNDDTIAAISTPVGFSGIGIVRVTGNKTFEIINKIFRSKVRTFNDFENRKIIYGHIIDNFTEDIIDEVLVSKMKGPKTYTKQDLVEVNCHGGIIPVKKILELILKNGARLAEPGEFTKRAFLNGRIDLTQAEAVIDIINAKTNKSLDISLKQLDGSISKKINVIRNKILEMLAHIEANIDYPEYDIEEVSYDEILKESIVVRNEVKDLIYNSENGRLIREGINTTIIGKPNVGKSSLLNTLLGHKRAIVTEIPGTTRDTIEEYISIEGVPLKIIDTAGIRETENIIEKIGIEKTKDILNQCDLVLLLLDSSNILDDDDIVLLKMINNKRAIILLNKVDKDVRINEKDIKKITNKQIVQISATEELGIERLKKCVLESVSDNGLELESFEIVSNIRHINLLKETNESLKHVIEAIKAKIPLELVSTDLKDSWGLLGEITGDTINEDIMDKIFSNFCIGK